MHDPLLIIGPPVTFWLPMYRPARSEDLGAASAAVFFNLLLVSGSRGAGGWPNGAQRPLSERRQTQCL